MSGGPGGLRVTLNGEEQSLEPGATIGELVDRFVRDRSRVAVERNREIVPRARYDSTYVERGDVIEVVTLVGGG